jgi:hypothetical protein
VISARSRAEIISRPPTGSQKPPKEGGRNMQCWVVIVGACRSPAFQDGSPSKFCSPIEVIGRVAGAIDVTNVDVDAVLSRALAMRSTLYQRSVGES